jgi:hypothetical protein
MSVFLHFFGDQYIIIGTVRSCVRRAMEFSNEAMIALCHQSLAPTKHAALVQLHRTQQNELKALEPF